MSNTLSVAELQNRFSPAVPEFHRIENPGPLRGLSTEPQRIAGTGMPHGRNVPSLPEGFYGFSMKRTGQADSRGARETGVARRPANPAKGGSPDGKGGTGRFNSLGKVMCTDGFVFIEVFGWFGTGSHVQTGMGGPRGIIIRH